MGNIFAANMNKMKADQMEQQRLMQERQMALQIARSRDNFLWLSGFYAVAATALISGYRKTKRQYLLAPLLPLTFVVAFNWDIAYGTKIHRIRTGAEDIMANESESLRMPSHPQSS